MMINKNPIDEQLAKRQWRADINNAFSGKLINQGAKFNENLQIWRNQSPFFSSESQKFCSEKKLKDPQFFSDKAINFIQS